MVQFSHVMKSHTSQWFNSHLFKCNFLSSTDLKWGQTDNKRSLLECCSKCGCMEFWVHWWHHIRSQGQRKAFSQRGHFGVFMAGKRLTVTFSVRFWCLRGRQGVNCHFLSDFGVFVAGKGLTVTFTVSMAVAQMMPVFVLLFLFLEPKDYTPSLPPLVET